VASKKSAGGGGSGGAGPLAADPARGGPKPVRRRRVLPGEKQERGTTTAREAWPDDAGPRRTTTPG
jgi:hypothetical protein